MGKENHKRQFYMRKAMVRWGPNLWRKLLFFVSVALLVPSNLYGLNLLHETGKQKSFPHFAALKSNFIHARVGPGLAYPISWCYQKKDLPVEVLLEFDGWQRVRDWQGSKAWIYGRLLSRKRTAIICSRQKKGKRFVALYAAPRETSPVVAHVEIGAIGKVRKCNGQWCKVHFSEIKGWVEQKLLWGVYPREIIE